MIQYTTQESKEIFITLDTGLCRLSIYNQTPNVAFLSTLIVDENNRNTGVGNQLLLLAEEVSKTNNCDTITLYVEPNSWMQKWYERKGFYVVCFDENMIIMSKRI